MRFSFFSFRQTLTLMCGVFGLLFSAVIFAKSVNLYEQPKADAKIVGTIDSASSMVPIITNKEGDWMKVGDPQNGNVGWLKLSDVSNSTAPGTVSSGFTMTQKIEGSANGPKTIRTIQFNNPSMSPEQANARAQEIQRRQAEIEKSTVQMIQNIFNNANAFYQANPDLYNTMNFPIIVPVMVMPGPQPAANGSISPNTTNSQATAAPSPAKKP